MSTILLYLSVVPSYREHQHPTTHEGQVGQILHHLAYLWLKGVKRGCCRGCLTHPSSQYLLHEGRGCGWTLEASVCTFFFPFAEEFSLETYQCKDKFTTYILHISDTYILTDVCHVLYLNPKKYAKKKIHTVLIFTILYKNTLLAWQY